jgi:biopolymer transport protein TolQ
MVGFGYRAVPAAPFPYDSEVSLHTCVLLALALQQGPAGAPAGTAAGGETNIVSLVARGPVTTKAVLVILLLFSAISWGVILYKMWQFHRAQRQSSSFLDIFRRSSKFSEVQAVCRTLADSPLVGIFQAGYAELTAQLKSNPPSATSSNPGRPGETQARPTLKSLDALDRSLLRASGVEVSRLEKRLTFLATVASITPFIGLFGTVWGIMNSFQQIGATGSTNLAVVAPGIADALIATAAGLFAAIPAVYFYNHFTQQVKSFVQTMEDFSLEFLTIAERNFT